MTPHPDSAWQVCTDRQRITFRSEAEAGPSPRPCSGACGRRIACH